MSLAKPKRVRDPKYLAWIRTQRCLLDWALSNEPKGCLFPVEAHHVREKGRRGIGTKPSDRRAVPLCKETHRWYHDHGREQFERDFGIDLEGTIRRLNAAYDKLHRRQPKPRRKILIEHCICGKKHVLYSCPVEKDTRVDL